MILHTQASADLPFEAPYGKVMESCHKLAETLKNSGQMQRNDIDAKFCQQRFKAINENGRKKNQREAKLSGAGEEIEYNEYDSLVEETISKVDLNEKKKIKKY